MAFGAENRYSPPGADKKISPAKGLHEVDSFDAMLAEQLADANAELHSKTAAGRAEAPDERRAANIASVEGQTPAVKTSDKPQRLRSVDAFDALLAEQLADANDELHAKTPAGKAEAAEAKRLAGIAAAREAIKKSRADGTYEAKKAEFAAKQASRGSNFEKGAPLSPDKQASLNKETNILQQGDTPQNEKLAWDDAERIAVSQQRKNKSESTGVDRAVMLQNQLDELNSKTADLLGEEIKKMRFWVINKATKAHKNLMDTNSVYAELVSRREKITSNIGVIESPGLRLNTTPEVNLSQPEPVVEQAPTPTARIERSVLPPSISNPERTAPTLKFLTNAEKKIIATDKVMRPEDTNQIRLVKLLARLKETFNIDMDEQGKMGFFSQRKFNKLYEQRIPAFEELTDKIVKTQTDLALERTPKEKSLRISNVIAAAADSGRSNKIADTGKGTMSGKA